MTLEIAHFIRNTIAEQVKNKGTSGLEIIGQDYGLFG